MSLISELIFNLVIFFPTNIIKFKAYCIKKFENMHKLRKLLILLFLLNLAYGKDLIIESNYPLPHNNLNEVYKETGNIKFIEEILKASEDFKYIKVVSSNRIKVKKKLILKTVRVFGNLSAWRKDILSSAGLMENYPIDIRDIYLIPFRIKNFYSEKGFPFAKVKLNVNIDNKNGYVYMDIYIDENYQYEIEKINILSNDKLSPDFKSKLIEVSKLEEEKYSLSNVDDAIDRIEKYLYKNGYFDAVVYFFNYEKIKTYPIILNRLFKNPLQVNLFVDLGTKYIFEFPKDIERDKKELLSLIDFSSEGFSKFLLEEFKEKIKEYYKDKNYLDVKVNYKLEKNLKENLIKIKFYIDKGIKYKISNIKLKTDVRNIERFFKNIDKTELSIKDIKNFLKKENEKLIKEGYYNANYDLKVNIDREKHLINISLDFKKGKKYILEKVILIDIPKYELDIKTPKVYDYQELQRILLDLKNYILSKGYLKGDVLLDTKTRFGKDNKVYITAIYKGKLGDKYVRYKPAIYGSYHLFPKYIERNIYDEENLIYSPEEEDSNTNYLYETYLFNSIYTYKIIDDKNRKVLEGYFLREDKRGLFRASIGYNTEDKLKISGLLTLKNMFNIGLEASGYVNFSSRRILSRISVGSRIFPFKISAFANFYKDYQYHRLFDKDVEGYGIWGERYINKWVKRGISIERNYIQVKNTDLNLGKYDKYFITKVKYTIKDNHRNFNVYPTKGYYFIGSITKYFEDLTYFKADSYIRYYYPLYKNVVWTQALNLGYIFDGINNVPISERYFIGRTEGFRGFGFESVGGSSGDGGKSFFVLSNELRFPIYANAVYGFIFTDIGNVFVDDRELMDFKTRETGGFGIFVPTPAGAIVFDIAKKLDKRQNESPYRIELSVEMRF